MSDLLTTLVTGGTRSGKSAVAEALIGTQAATYLACGAPRDDDDWNERIRLHRQRRPAAWATIESIDVAAVLARAQSPVLVDCLGTWLTAQLDQLDAWQAPIAAFSAELRQRIDELAEAVTACPHPVVLVTNEVGMSLISMDRSGRIFTDWLGWLNQEVARRCDRVVLVVAGHSLVIKDAN